MSVCPKCGKIVYFGEYTFLGALFAWSVHCTHNNPCTRCEPFLMREILRKNISLTQPRLAALRSLGRIIRVCFHLEHTQGKSAGKSQHQLKLNPEQQFQQFFCCDIQYTIHPLPLVRSYWDMKQMPTCAKHCG